MSVCISLANDGTAGCQVCQTQYSHQAQQMHPRDTVHHVLSMFNMLWHAILGAVGDLQAIEQLSKWLHSAVNAKQQPTSCAAQTMSKRGQSAGLHRQCDTQQHVAALHRQRQWQKAFVEHLPSGLQLGHINAGCVLIHFYSCQCSRPGHHQLV